MSRRPTPPSVPTPAPKPLPPVVVVSRWRFPTNGHWLDAVVAYGEAGYEIKAVLDGGVFMQRPRTTR